jgi:hypothetical protein
MKYQRLTTACLSFCVAILSAMPAVKAASYASFTVIADGLNHPRGLSFSSDGSLYVTEAGVGGNGDCVPPPSGQGDLLCYGTTGAVTKIKDGRVDRIITGLSSLALPDGSGAAGPRDIQFDHSGQPYILVGYGANPAIGSTYFRDTALGKVILADLQTNSHVNIADVANYELVNNPDGEDINSNPLSFLIDDGKLILVDAGANDLLSLKLSANLDGSNLQLISTFPQEVLTNPVFPSFASPSSEPNQVPSLDENQALPLTIQSVPSSVTKGLDGAYYVSQFTGFPFPEGQAKVYRVTADGQINIYADNLTQLTDLKFDQAGNLYVLQYANQSAWKGNRDGSLIKIAADGTRTTILSGNGLEAPNALTISPDGDIYITNRGDRPGQGQIIKIVNSQSIPEPTSVFSLLVFGSLGLSRIWQLRNTSSLKK